MRQTTAMLWALFVASVVATARAAWPPGNEIPCARWTYPLGQSKNSYCGNEFDGPPMPYECTSCDRCRTRCKGRGYKFGMCVKQVMHTKYLPKLPCYNVFKCICTDDAPAKGCKSCSRECELENRFVSGTCNRQTYECQCRYPDPFTAAQRNVVIAEHNGRRTNLTRGLETSGRAVGNEKFVQASNIFKLTWDTDLELLARRKASVCVGDYNGGGDEIPNQGLNFASYNGVMGPVKAAKEAISYFWNHKQYFYVETGNMEIGQNLEIGAHCYPFTQMAWALVTRFACSVGSCKQAKNTIIACVFDRSIHQYPSEKLYNPGKPCSGCKGAGGTNRQCKPPNSFLCTTS